MIKISDFPKIESPFVRVVNKKNDYVVTPEVTPGYNWVFDNPDVIAVEKLHGTNVSVVIEDGYVKSVWNRTARIPLWNKGKMFIIKGMQESYERGYLNLPDGQHFGELIGPKVNGNPYNLDGCLWLPFRTYCEKHLRYKSFGKYPKNFEAFSEWFKTLMPLFALRRGDKEGFVEGVVFYHPDGRMAKLRLDMWDWFTGKRH